MMKYFSFINLYLIGLTVEINGWVMCLFYLLMHDLIQWSKATTKSKILGKLAWQNTFFLTLIFQFLTWLQYVLEAMHLYCISVQQKIPCYRLQVTHLNFSHFQGFGRFTRTADSWFNLWQCHKRHSCFFTWSHNLRMHCLWI